MKKTICLILCLSIIFTLVLGITAASAESVYARSSYKISGYKVTGYGYDAQAKKGYFAHLKVYLTVNYTRGVGLSNEGQKYTKRGECEKISKYRWDKVDQVSVTVYGNNSRDDVKDVSCYARKWWTVN